MRTRPFGTLAVLALAGAAVLAPVVPAAAHGDTVHLEVAGQDGGHITTVATWENDHDPVTEEFAGTLAAASADGRSAGPWRLVAVPGRPGAYTTREILPAGHWRITVDCAFPSLGHGERELDVEATAISDPTLPVPGSAATPTLGPTLAPTPAPSATPAASPSASLSTSPSVAAAGKPSGPSAGPATATLAGGPADGSDSGSDAATWAAVATAVAAVLLVAAGYWLRRGTRPRTGARLR
ncbi:hypothetical protein ACGFZP_28600 [Kitasatospora sp. NPDC048239]|uniref:hypothetical protein n=1 Tax=Kitasatospora sp. NPDC048239 TaxID=3364046 RepID=UPI00371618C7